MNMKKLFLLNLPYLLFVYASGMISLPEGMLQEGDTENEETEEKNE